ncbi:TetR/AcrR family transcriptional regulator [Streptomyces sp. SID3343]|uniref:TetR/AcrR family transcriptional regulator n=1 Tax=Streptomyces sp. SID3343 TaxID=2690260 RepID=UPI00136F0934|nr:TetR/AcrR family transcriptional regulator [Streptomyces sp. SID3343]MYW00115.1 TetR family transcriptional regulator [Streptomyces sp. SID3343]
MPKVSQEHLDARRRQIIDAARLCFARNGFHRTSMPDVFAASGLSAGAVYRYFKSKDELIAACCTDALQAVAATLPDPDALRGDTASAVPMGAMLDRLVDSVVALDGEEGIGRVAIQVWGEAIRDPDLAAHVRTEYDAVLDRLVAVCAHYRDTGALAPTVDPKVVALAVMALLQGFTVQRTVLGHTSQADFKAGMHALLNTAG